MRNLFFGVAVLVVVLAVGTFLARAFSITYQAIETPEDDTQSALQDGAIIDTSDTKAVSAIHLPTPEPLKAIYMTSWVAGTPSIRKGLLELIDTTEINAIVIDIKDDTGRISYEVSDPTLYEFGSWENRIPSVRELIERLHESGVYVIGRVSVFQDPYFTGIRPDLAVKRASDGAVWKDRKGLSFIDVGAEEYWEYIVAIVRDAYAAGFDEINFDYVRFPSDGNMRDISYPFSEERIQANPTRGMALTLEAFFSYLYSELKDTDVVLSADLFGYTTTNKDDLGIGQLLERALPYFDYIMPMVYPSHYNAGFIGHQNPAVYPYEVVKYSMDSAVARAEKMARAKESTATSTDIAYLREQALKGHGTISANQLRPWLQDFDLGATYTADMVRGQIQATYDAGLSSWALWDASNTYTRGALEPN